MLGEFQWTTAHLIIVLAMGIPLVSVIGGLWYAMERTRSENELKRSMIDRGMSADEIERVLNARGNQK